MTFFCLFIFYEGFFCLVCLFVFNGGFLVLGRGVLFVCFIFVYLFCLYLCMGVLGGECSFSCLLFSFYSYFCFIVVVCVLLLGLFLCCWLFVFFGGGSFEGM